MSELRFYFDPQSPYSYLAWKWLQSKNDEFSDRGISVLALPLSMGSLIASYETKGPAEIPPKRDFLFKQCLRRAAQQAIELKTPYQLPINPVFLLRLCLKDVSGNLQWDVIDTLFEGIWKNCLNMESDSVIAEILSKKVGVDEFEKINYNSSLPIARKSLKENLRQAKEDGAFGVPSFICNDELFWGYDSVQDLEAFLEGKDSLPKDEYNHFTQLFKS